MATFTDKLVAGFEHARRINEALWLDGADSQNASIDELHEIVQRTYDINIEFIVLPIETEHVYGMIHRYAGGSAKIYLVESVPDRWKRLVGAKELCHVVIDTQDDFTTNGEDTLQRLVALRGVDLNAPENAGLRSEHVAEIVAWELLYPHELRAAEVVKCKGNPPALASLAARLQLPEQVLSFIHSAPYMEMCDKVWHEVDRLSRLPRAAV